MHLDVHLPKLFDVKQAGTDLKSIIMGLSKPRCAWAQRPAPSGTWGRLKPPRGLRGGAGGIRNATTQAATRKVFLVRTHPQALRSYAALPGAPIAMPGPRKGICPAATEVKRKRKRNLLGLRVLSA